MYELTVMNVVDNEIDTKSLEGDLGIAGGSPNASSERPVPTGL